jgi:hypothetical protein
MPIIRLLFILVFIALCVLGAAFVVTRNRKYLNSITQLLTYVGWGFAVVAVLFLIARIIRI